MTDQSYANATPDDVAGLVAGGAVLLDVREDDEWDAGHAPNAHHHPLGELDAMAVPDGPLVTICRSGKRSAKAAEQLAAAGRQVTNVEGGMTAWEKTGLPVVTDDGSPGRVA